MTILNTLKVALFLVEDAKGCNKDDNLGAHLTQLISAIQEAIEEITK